jgi:hypothetical protein
MWVNSSDDRGDRDRESNIDEERDEESNEESDKEIKKLHDEERCKACTAGGCIGRVYNDSRRKYNDSNLRFY